MATKRVLLTGATGFVGSHLVRALLSRGHEITLLVHPSSDARRLLSVRDRIAILNRRDISPPAALQRLTGLDAVIHVATLYGRRGEDSSDIVESNVVFPLQLLEAAIRHKVPLFINTDSYYAKSEQLYSHLDRYSLSKQDFLRWGRIAVARTGVRFVNVRLEHVYGPEDSADKFTRSIVRACVANEAEINLTPGHQLRDFIYVEDVASAYLSVLEAPLESLSQSYEVGSGTPTSIRDWVENVWRSAGSKTILRFGVLPLRDGEIMRSEADTFGLQKLGWKANTSLSDGIRRTIEWERSQTGEPALYPGMKQQRPSDT